MNFSKIVLVCIQSIIIFVPIIYFILPDNGHIISKVLFGILGILLFVMLFLKVYLKKIWMQNAYLKIPLFLYLFTILISVKNSGNVKLVFESALFFLILMLIYYAVLLFSEKECSSLINAFIVSAAVITCFAFSQYLSINFFKWLPNFIIDFNINNYSGFFLLMFPIIFIMMIQTRGILKHVFLMLFCFVICINLIVTKICSVWVIFLVSMLLLVYGQVIYLKRKFSTIKRISRGSYWISLMVFAILLFSIDKYGTLKKYICRDDVLVNNSVTYFMAAWQTVKEFPVFGIGAGSTPKYNSGIFIKHFIETGLLGLAIYVLIFIRYFYICISGFLKNIDFKESDFNMLFGIFIGITSFFLHTLTIYSFFAFPVYIILFVFLGLSESYLKNSAIV